MGLKMKKKAEKIAKRKAELLKAKRLKDLKKQGKVVPMKVKVNQWTGLAMNKNDE